MSVRTEADDCRWDALDKVKDAIKNISAIVIEQVDGSKDYDKDRMSSVLSDLIGCRNILEP